MKIVTATQKANYKLENGICPDCPSLEEMLK